MYYPRLEKFIPMPRVRQSRNAARNCALTTNWASRRSVRSSEGAILAPVKNLAPVSRHSHLGEGDAAVPAERSLNAFRQLKDHCTQRPPTCPSEATQRDASLRRRGGGGDSYQ